MQWPGMATRRSSGYHIFLAERRFLWLLTGNTNRAYAASERRSLMGSEHSIRLGEQTRASLSSACTVARTVNAVVPNAGRAHTDSLFSMFRPTVTCWDAIVSISSRCAQISPRAIPRTTSVVGCQQSSRTQLRLLRFPLGSAQSAVDLHSHVPPFRHRSDQTDVRRCGVGSDTLSIRARSAWTVHGRAEAAASRRSSHWPTVSGALSRNSSPAAYSVYRPLADLPVECAGAPTAAMYASSTLAMSRRNAREISKTADLRPTDKFDH